jgi:hypothetical protein
LEEQLLKVVVEENPDKFLKANTANVFSWNEIRADKQYE